jgi:hypothetical protein
MTRLVVLRRWWPAALVALIVAGVSTTTLYSYLTSRGPFWEKYQQVQMGMTEQQVTALLGPPTAKEHLGGSTAPYALIWKNDSQIITVQFYSDGIAYEKHFRR